MTLPPAASQEFELRISLIGVMMHAFNTTGTKLAVVLPDARLVDPADPLPPHPGDTEPAEAHAGYLRFNLRNLAHTADLGAVPEWEPEDPEYEVVHRFDGERLELELPQGATPGEGRNDPYDPVALADGTAIEGWNELMVPDLEGVAPILEPRPEVLAPDPIDGVVMRMDLSGGRIAIAAPNAVSWKFSKALRPSGTSDTEAYSGEFGGEVVWRRTLRTEGILLRLRRADGSTRVAIPLRPTGEGDGRQITLKISNLCKLNPLEWPELPQRDDMQRDEDSKWVYRLMRVRDASHAPQLASTSLPVPERVNPLADEGKRIACLPVRATTDF